MSHALTRGLTVGALAVCALAGCSSSSDSAATPSSTAAAKVEAAALPSPSEGATPLPIATPDPSLEASIEPSAGASEEPAPGNGLTAAQQALVDRLRPGTVSDCKGNTAAEGDDVTAAVTCTAGDHSVQAFSYPSAEAVSRQAETRGTGLPTNGINGSNGKCADDNDVRTTWQNRRVIQGDLICTHDGNQAVAFWTYYSELVGFQVSGDAPAGGYKFWLTFDPI